MGSYTSIWVNKFEIYSSKNFIEHYVTGNIFTHSDFHKVVRPIKERPNVDLENLENPNKLEEGFYYKTIISVAKQRFKIIGHKKKTFYQNSTNL
ncbi:MAG: hypothetical protein ACI85O_002434 [Saprospiraceae bacterium]|jgi:hypothetical protein